MEVFDLDAYFIKFLRKITWLKLQNFSDYQEFFSHFLLHSTLCFLFLTISIYLAPLSLFIAVLKEMIWDKQYFGLFSDLDGRTDLIARSLGATLPLITLIWC